MSKSIIYILIRLTLSANPNVEPIHFGDQECVIIELIKCKKFTSSKVKFKYSWKISLC